MMVEVFNPDDGLSVDPNISWNFHPNLHLFYKKILEQPNNACGATFTIKLKLLLQKFD